MLFKAISYLELWRLFCSTEWNYLFNFVRGHYEEQVCEFYFEFGQVVQVEMSFKRFLIWSSGGPPVQWSGTIYANLKEGSMGNIHVK